MSFLGKIFTWWDGATIGTLLDSSLKGELVGTDAQGNKYYRSRKPYPAGHPRAGEERRWVIYDGANDASRVPAEWHGWLHGASTACPKATCRRRASGKRTTRPTPPAPRWPIGRRARWNAAASARPRPATTKPGLRNKRRPAPMNRLSRPLLPLACAALAGLGGCQRQPEAAPPPEATETGAPAAAGSGGVVESEYGTPVKDRVATLGFLNKRNNITQVLVLRSGEARRIGNAIVAGHLRAHRAVGRPAGNRRLRPAVRAGARPPEKLAWHKVFSGWLFKNSPSLNVVEHPVYDVWVKDCAMKFPGEEDDPASASSAAKPAGKPSTAPAPATAPWPQRPPLPSLPPQARYPGSRPPETVWRQHRR
jgi:NADH:ubiquinone oxidoreductase subunit